MTVAGVSTDDYIGEGAAQRALNNLVSEIRKRKAQIMSRLGKRLAPDDYIATCGALGELEYFEGFIFDTVRRHQRSTEKTDGTSDT